MSPKQGLVVVGAVLAATIRVQQDLFRRLSACNGYLQRSVYQRLLHAVVHSPADNSVRSAASRLKDSRKRRLVWVTNTPCGGHHPP